MSKRIPPSAEQIAQALYERLVEMPATHGPRVLIPISDASRMIREAFNTSPVKAVEWLRAAALSDGHPIEILQASGTGRTSLVLRNGEREGTRPRWVVMTQELGVGFSTTSPQLRLWGGYAIADAADAKYDPFAKRPADGTEWVAVSKFFRPVVQEYADQYAAKQVTREGEKIIESATVEHRHGEPIAYIRGLLDAAILISYPGVETIRVDHNGDKGRVRIELVGDSIDRVGDLLRQLGVQPQKEDDR